MAYGFGQFGRAWGFGGAAAAPARAFSPIDLAPNLWMPSDPLAMFKSADGSENASANDDTIGLILDQSQMDGAAPARFLATQPELIANSSFESDLAGWVLVSGFSGTEASWQAGRARLVNSVGDSVVGVQTTANTVPGTWYRLEASCVSSSDGWRFGAGAISNNPNIADSGRIVSGPAVRQLIFRATATTTFIQLYNAPGTTSGGDASLFDYASLKALSGNHAVQTTPTSCPKFKQARFRQYDGVDDFLVGSAKCGATGNTLAMKVTVPNTTSTQVFCGMEDAVTSNCFYLAISGGTLRGGVGGQGVSVIRDTLAEDLRGQTGMAVLMEDGATVYLFWNDRLAYSGARGGAPGTTYPLFEGVLNTAGTGRAFSTVSVHDRLFFQRAITPTERAQILNYWS